MRIGLFFGSFNPVHRGHIEIATYFIKNTDLEEVWLVVSPQNPLKDNAELLTIDKRLEMVHAAIEHHEDIKCCEVELELPKPSYTIDTLRNLSITHPNHEFIIIMGTDNLENFNLWKSYEEILKDYNIYVYPRAGSSSSTFEGHPSVTLIDSELFEVSATMLRDQIRNRNNSKWLPDSVAKIIFKKGYYSNPK